MKEDRKFSLMQTLVAVLLLWGGVALVVYLKGEDWATRGQIGDMFGVVNALFSGLAFALLIFTIYLQRQEIQLQSEALKAQQEELRLTRKEVKRSAEAQERSEEALRRQADSLKQTARINALSTLIETTTAELSAIMRIEKKSDDVVGRHNRLIGERENYVRELKGILEQKRD